MKKPLTSLGLFAAAVLPALLLLLFPSDPLGVWAAAQDLANAQRLNADYDRRSEEAHARLHEKDQATIALVTGRRSLEETVALFRRLDGAGGEEARRCVLTWAAAEFSLENETAETLLSRLSRLSGVPAGLTRGLTRTARRDFSHIPGPRIVTPGGAG